jgi:hypothetical protein
VKVWSGPRHGKDDAETVGLPPATRYVRGRLVSAHESKPGDLPGSCRHDSHEGLGRALDTTTPQIQNLFSFIDSNLAIASLRTAPCSFVGNGVFLFSQLYFSHLFLKSFSQIFLQSFGRDSNWKECRRMTRFKPHRRTDLRRAGR